VHLVVWVKFAFEEDQKTSDLTDAARAETEAYVDETFRRASGSKEVGYTTIQREGQMLTSIRLDYRSSGSRIGPRLSLCMRWNTFTSCYMIRIQSSLRKSQEAMCQCRRGEHTVLDLRPTLQLDGSDSENKETHGTVD